MDQPPPYEVAKGQGYANGPGPGNPCGPNPGYPGAQIIASPSGQSPSYPGGHTPAYVVGTEQVIMTQPHQVGNTTVIIQQPAGGYRPSKRDWNTDLFSCFDDMSICMCGWCCTLCLMCQVTSNMEENCCVTLCTCCPIMALRIKWRAEHNIEGSIMKDCCTSYWCGMCALCQLAREIKTEKQQR